MTLTEAMAVLRDAGLTDDADRIEDAIEHPDMATGFMDHRVPMTYGPNPHQNIAANAKQHEWMDVRDTALRMLRGRLAWES